MFSRMQQTVNQANKEPQAKLKQAMMKAEAVAQAKQGICDVVYKQLIETMLEETSKQKGRNALVFINSFDHAIDSIEDYMEANRIYTEVFEIDRMRAPERTEYLNCLNTMFGTKQLPMIFVGDKFVGSFDKLKEF